MVLHHKNGVPRHPVPHGIPGRDVKKLSCRMRDDEKLGPAAIARRLGIGRASVYRVFVKPP